MIPRTLVSLVLLVAATFDRSAAAPAGKVVEEETLESKILGGARKYAVYLPPDYEHSSRKYPVLYLLHGGGDDQTGWIQFGEVQHIADKAIRQGVVTPMVVIMPDANAGRRGYLNSIDGKWRYEDFFFEELVPFVESAYRIKGEKRYRAVAGLSMGGGGSFMYALHRPEMFSAACPLSASTGALTVDELKKRLNRDKVDYEEDQLEPWMERNTALPLIDKLPKGAPDDPWDPKRVRWYIDCGDDDQLFEGNALVHIALRKKEIPHEFRIRDGGHNWTYWRTALPEVLRFVTEGFHQP